MTDAIPDAASPEHLTDVLHRAGVLSAGRVASVTVEMSRQTLISAVMRLRLEVDGQAGAAPFRVFFKTRRVDGPVRAEGVGRAEVDFYSRVAPLTPAGLLPRCFEAVAGAEGRWYLLLEDLGDSHDIVSEWPLPPTVEQCDRIIGAHARFHAFWWDHPGLGGSIGAFLDAGAFDRFLAEFPQQFAAFVDRLGDRMPPERRRVYERLMASASRLFDERYRPHRNLTLVHGDAHVWNAFYPRDARSDDVRLIDWDSWRIDVATDDLAYMMAIHWYPERRRRLERECLQRYHAALAGAGVTGYDLDALWQDYRQSVLWQITTPVWQATHGLGAWIWWSHFERIMLAVEDLDCLEFLD
jgi:thiamine kinase-like enzyme